MMQKQLTQKRLKELLDYNPETGDFTWKIDRGRTAKKGDTAGYTDPDGYKQIRIGKTLYQSHRLAWFYTYGYFSENDTDHINRNPSDNRIVNLREVSHQCNLRNQGNPKNNKSGVKGVCWKASDKKWVAQITVMNKNKNLGRYLDFDDAVCARLAAEQCLNWDGCDSLSPAFKYVQKMMEDNNV